MRVSESCAKCLYDRQKARCGDDAYLALVRKIIEEREENDTSPLLVYRFSQAYEEMLGRPRTGYADVKRHYNDLMLGMESRLLSRIESSADPVMTALVFARAANYIDYGAMDHVSEDECLALLEKAALRAEERNTYGRLMQELADARRFLLIADNCGEIVLDKLFLEQLRKRFSQLRLQVLVRGGEVLNDVTLPDAEYVGINHFAEIISNGQAVAGTIYSLMPEDARDALDRADVILAKGQGNYESLSGQGRHVYYAFLCKCDLFMERFSVPHLTGMLVEE